MMRSDPLANPAPLIRRVYAYVAYRVGHGPDAEDVTGEVFERAVRYRSTYDGSRGEPLSWLLGIARRCVDDALSRRTPLPSSDAEVAEQASDGDLEDETVRRLTIADAVGRLEGRDRDLLALRYGADLTARQIGEIVGLKANAVEVALHRALGRIRADFAPVSERPPPPAGQPVRRGSLP